MHVEPTQSYQPASYGGYRQDCPGGSCYYPGNSYGGQYGGAYGERQGRHLSASMSNRFDGYGWDR